MRKEFYALYNMMANSQEVEYMRIFGNVHKMMFEWFNANKPDMAAEYLDKLEAIRWNQYLTKKEADKIVSDMKPAPWTYDQWAAAMEKADIKADCEPCYNKYALFVTMENIMSTSGNTIAKYVGSDDIFNAVYELAVDKLTGDKYMIRHTYGL